jgi:HD-like signal output (HDOD) protein
MIDIKDLLGHRCGTMTTVITFLGFRHARDILTGHLHRQHSSCQRSKHSVQELRDDFTDVSNVRVMA